jgi:hypothetical protein
MSDKPIQITCETRKRLEHICNMMRNLTWKTGRSAQDLAKLWELSPHTVRRLATEAAKIVRREVTNPDRVGRTVGAALDQVLHDALAKGDHRTVISASKIWAEISGAVAPKQVEMQVTEKDLTTEELKERLSRLAQRAKELEVSKQEEANTDERSAQEETEDF